MIPGAACATCVFYQPRFDNDQVGQCRCHAPHTQRLQSGEVRTIWPGVTSTMWCGQHTTPVEETEE